MFKGMAVHNRPSAFFSMAGFKSLAACLLLSILSVPGTAADFPTPFLEPAPEPARAQIQFLGTAGVLLQVGQDAILTDPYFTNAPLSHWLLLRHLRSDMDTIHRYLPDLSAVKGLLVGHGHFDHLLDVPAVVPLLPDATKVYGSQTSVNQIAAAVPAERRVNLLPQAVTFTTQPPFPWVNLSDSLRLLAVRSGHSRHVGGMMFADQQVQKPLEALPADVLDWQCGVALGYVLEWRQGEQVRFRALYLSSAADYPLGVPPQAYLEGQSEFDVVFLPVATFRSVEAFPEGLLKHLQARHLVLIHWEKFWQPYQPGQEEPLSEKDLSVMRERLGKVAPDAVIHQPVRLETLTISLSSEK